MRALGQMLDLERLGVYMLCVGLGAASFRSGAKRFRSYLRAP